MALNEEELPGASNELPPATKEALKNKPSLEQVRNRIPPPSDKYQAFNHPDRQASSLLHDMFEPIDYFNVFISPLLRADWAVWTNANAEKKSKEFNQNQNINIEALKNKRPWEDFQTEQQRPWQDTDSFEIGVFLGCLLLMGCSTNPSIPDYWDTHTDTGRNPEICKVIINKRN